MQKLASKFIEVMRDCSHISKNGKNDFHGYKYATSADVLERVNASLVAHGIASIATPELLNVVDVTTAKGNVEHLATIRMDITLIDKESGEVLSIGGIGSGQDGGDKAVMKAQTAAIKYAYMLSLSISTGDDPEADRRTDEGADSAAMHQSVATVGKAKMHRANIGRPVLTCCDCGLQITEKVQKFSERRYGRALCMDCQHRAQGIA